MPCYEIRTCSISFSVGNIELLKIAIEENATNDFQRHSLTVSGEKVLFRDRYQNRIEIDLANGKITGANMGDKQLADLSNSVKRSYSRVVIDELARKQKWIKKRVDNHQYQLQRF